MTKTKQELLDQFATAALTALISKMPLYDSNGKYGEPIDDQELQTIKKDMTATAYEYAGWMMIAREDSKKWLKENEEFNPEFGS
ncbi:MAG: hypothetical protein KDB85_04225 [Chitinophagales bacterium]|nr:hypothetical protein [Chitinophagales bacterium]